MATFVISATTATFGAVMRGSSQEAGDVPRLVLTASFLNETAWRTMLSLVTTKYHVQVPLGGSAVVDAVNGPGAGTLTLSELGAATAVLVGLSRSTWVRNHVNLGTATFLITGAWS